MYYMQNIGIVHRDLKSANVLLETIPFGVNKSILRAVVCDFGLARVTHRAISVDGQKFKDIGGFSPRYAAPEVLASVAMNLVTDPDADKKSDVYSFAIILWEMLARATPWAGLKREEIEPKVRSGVRVRPSLFFLLEFFFFGQVFQYSFLSLQPPVPADDGADPAKNILIDMMTSCWQENPAFRPSFEQISSKIASLL